MVSTQQRTSLSIACIVAVAVSSAVSIAVGAVCDGIPQAECPEAPASFQVEAPPAVVFPVGPKVCGICSGRGGGGTCFRSTDCVGGQCVYQPICGPHGCITPNPDTMKYVDAQCFPQRLSEPDDTCRLKRAAAEAAGRVLWIASGQTFEISPYGEEIGLCKGDSDIQPGSQHEHVHGIPIQSGTIVTGGGTIKLRVYDPPSPNPVCDNDDNFQPSDEEVCNTGHLLKIGGHPGGVLQSVYGVTISGITFDGNSRELACPDEFYPGRCEGRHAVEIVGDATNITIENCHFVGLVGDGVSIGKLAPGIDPGGPNAKSPHSVVVRNNTFSTWPEHRNRNGVSVGSVSDLLIEGNHFEQMGRGYFSLSDVCEVDPGGGPPDCRRGPPVGMPGPIDLEPDHPWHESVERVEIANNTMIGWDGCFTQGGIGVSNHEHADVMVQDVLIRDNKISGCFQRGITIIGSGRDGHPIVVRDNTLQTTRPNPRIPGRWEIGVAGRILEGVHRPSYADIRANKIIGDGTLDGIESDGTDMIGLYVRASKTMFAGNCIEGAHKLGVDFDEHYEDAPAVSFTGQNVFCGNLLRRNGTDPAMSAMALSGICHQVRSNLFEASPRGVEVRSGTENEFFTNSFDACDVSPCVHCAGTPNVGCQNFAGPDQLTNCVSCPPNSGCLPSGGGGGDDPIAIDP